MVNSCNFTCEELPCFVDKSMLERAVLEFTSDSMPETLSYGHSQGYSQNLFAHIRDAGRNGCFVMTSGNTRAIITSEYDDEPFAPVRSDSLLKFKLYRLYSKEEQEKLLHFSPVELNLIKRRDTRWLQLDPDILDRAEKDEYSSNDLIFMLKRADELGYSLRMMKQIENMRSCGCLTLAGDYGPAIITSSKVGDGIKFELLKFSDRIYQMFGIGSPEDKEIDYYRLRKEA